MINRSNETDERTTPKNGQRPARPVPPLAQEKSSTETFPGQIAQDDDSNLQLKQNKK